MNKLKEKLGSAMRSTALSAQQIYKHKSFKLAKTQENPEWDEPYEQFMKLHKEVTDLVEEVEKFQKIITDLCGNMVKIGETLMTGVQETDSEASQKIATSYDQIMKECADEPLKSATQRITEEILTPLRGKLNDMKEVLMAIEARKKAKMDYDHYYFKVEELQSKPNTDPNKMVRNQDKRQECQTTLTTITDRLISKFDEYEAARPTFLAYETRTFRSVQKEFFSALAQKMDKFKVTKPYEGMPQEPIVARYDPNSSFAQADLPGARRGPKARRNEADDDDEDDDEDPRARRGGPQARRSAQQGSFRRPTPGGQAENAFSRGGQKKNPFGGKGASAPVPVDVDDMEETARPARKPKGVMARVLYDFAGEDADELPLREGQKVRVTRQHESGWWTGEINGKVGMFPANYVELLWTV